MHPTVLRLSLALALLGTGCERPEPVEPGQRAPDVAWTPDGDARADDAPAVELATLQGQTVVLHFADAASPTWHDLAAAYPDLDAEGAAVWGVITDDGAVEAPFPTTHDELATAFGVDAHPTAVVVDPEGWIRGRQLVDGADAFFALAAPVLLEGERAGTTVSVPEPGAAGLDAASLASLARAGAALIDVRPDTARDTDGLVPLAVPCPVETLTPRDLPADLAATVVFLGPESGRAADLAVDWGYSSVIVLTDAAPYLDADAAPVERAPALAPLSEPRTVRG